MYNMYSVEYSSYTILPLLFSLFETALADECPRGPPLMFRAAKITLRIGFTARHFDQFRGCSTGRTFHTPAGRARAQSPQRARYKALFQRNCQVESSGAELNSCRDGGARSLVYFLWLIRVRVASRKFAYSNSRGVVTSFVLFSSAHRIGHLSGARIYSLACNTS